MRDDHETWRIFIDVYSPLIRHYASEAGARPDQEEDILQEVMIWLYSSDWELDLPRRGSFRRWLRQVVRNFTRMQQNGRSTKAWATLDPALVDEMEEEGCTRFHELDAEVRMELIERALHVLRPQFHERGWDIFRRVYVENLKVDEVATELGVSRNVVYVYGCRIMRKVKEVVAELVDEI